MLAGPGEGGRGKSGKTDEGKKQEKALGKGEDEKEAGG